MNHDAPVTPAAMQAHIAELEQQLKLSDEGVSRLAQRCLELEQQSKASDELYYAFPLFLEMLDSPNAFVWVRGFRLLCAQAKWDTDA